MAIFASIIKVGLNFRVHEVVLVPRNKAYVKDVCIPTFVPLVEETHCAIEPDG